MSKQNQGIKNYTFEKPDGTMVSIEAKKEKEAKAKFAKKYGK